MSRTAPSYESIRPGNTAVNSAAGSLLDIGHQNCTVGEAWCKICKQSKRRRGRGFHRAMSGLRLQGAWQMWTLTTSLEAYQGGKSIQASFRALVMRLRRRGLCSGYMKVVEYTKRGLPHLHVLVRGQPIPHWYLSGLWAQIHLSPVVWFSKIRHRAGAGAYLAKYLGKDPRARYSYSWSWVWKGFAGDWKRHVSDCLSNGLSMLDAIDWWNDILDEFSRKRALNP